MEVLARDGRAFIAMKWNDLPLSRTFVSRAFVCGDSETSLVEPSKEKSSTIPLPMTPHDPFGS